jgi:hypothetical protein
LVPNCFAIRRAGWGGAGLGPLAWAGHLRRDGAPGAEPAAEAVRLYLEARFAGYTSDVNRADALDRAAEQAVSALRQVPRRRKSRPAAGV